MRRAHRSRESGFTLIELLASLSVLAMLGLMLVAGVTGRSLAWARMDRQTSAGETVEAVQAALRDRIEHIWPQTSYDFMQPRTDFKGGPARIEFLAPPVRARELGPLRRYQLELDVNGDLLLDSLSDLALDRMHWSDRQVLMRGVQALDLAYYGAAVPGQPAGWRGDWVQQSAPPSLVRVRLSFPEGDRRVWPELIVHPQVNIDTDCVIVATGGCSGR